MTLCTHRKLNSTAIPCLPVADCCFSMWNLFSFVSPAVHAAGPACIPIGQLQVRLQTGLRVSVRWRAHLVLRGQHGARRVHEDAARRAEHVRYCTVLCLLPHAWNRNSHLDEYNAIRCLPFYCRYRLLKCREAGAMALLSNTLMVAILALLTSRLIIIWKLPGNIMVGGSRNTAGCSTHSIFV